MLSRSKVLGAIAAIVIFAICADDLRGRSSTSVVALVQVAPELEIPEVEASAEMTPEPPSIGPLTARASEVGCFEIPRIRSVHNRATPFPRNGFLFLEEERTGKSFDQILAERLEAQSTLATPMDPPRENSELAAIHDAALRRTQALLALDAIELSAVLIASERGSAILNGEVVVVGATVGGTEWVLHEVSTSGVVLTRDGEPFDLPLAPLSKKKNSTAPTPEPSSAIEDDEVTPEPPASAAEPSAEAGTDDPKESS